VDIPVDVIPSELRSQPQWVVWQYETRDGERTKVPYQARLGETRRARASSTDPATWTSFDTALTFYQVESWPEGIGFVLTADDPFVGVDLDHCVGDQIDPWARTIVRTLSSYTEVTPSGEGLRVFVRGTLPPGGRKKSNFEVYDRKRFLTVTGNRVSRASIVEERTAELARIHAEIFGVSANGVAKLPQDLPRQPLEVADAELLNRARAAVNGAAFWSLWNGEASTYGSASEADLALCSHLAWWTGGSPARTDYLFRQSGLMRPKWDERHGDRTYGQRTIDKALSTMTGFYEPGFTSSTPRLRLFVRPGEAPPAEDEPLPMTDVGNGQRLVARYGHALRYCHPWSKWLAWDGARWRLDDTGAVWRMAKHTARAIFQEAADVKSVELAKKLGAHAIRTQADGKLAAMIHQAESEPTIPVLPDDLDADPWLCCVANGVIDLRTGELGEHDRDLLITKYAPVMYDPQARCPVWDQFLYRILDGNTELIAFVQRAVGYSLTGVTRERVLFFLHGTGSNGKSTLIETARSLLGEYAQRTPTDTLLAKRENAIPNDVARLRGARFVSAVETEEGKRLAEALVKDLTGGDTIAARFMRGEWFDFKPSFKIWLGTNHKPVIRGTDNAIWNRIRLIPFTVTIPENEQDPQLANKLQAELPGILAWAVRGCLAWQRDGLGMPTEVRAATESYRADMDVLAAFLQDSCIVDPQATVAARALYEAYKRWCEDTGEHAITQRRVGQSLSERSFERLHGEHGWSWRGLRLRMPGEPPRGGTLVSADPLTSENQSQADPSDPDSDIAHRKNDVLQLISESGSGRVRGQPDQKTGAELPW
jgi:putative DNA primase/helicase